MKNIRYKEQYSTFGDANILRKDNWMLSLFCLCNFEAKQQILVVIIKAFLKKKLIVEVFPLKEGKMPSLLLGWCLQSRSAPGIAVILLTCCLQLLAWPESLYQFEGKCSTYLENWEVEEINYLPRANNILCCFFQTCFLQVGSHWSCLNQTKTEAMCCISSWKYRNTGSQRKFCLLEQYVNKGLYCSTE